jgi:arabinose-5-phosphate isomerase
MVNPGQLLSPKASMRDVVVALAHGRGIAPIVDDGQLVGVITAGDLTRLVERTPDFTGALAGEVMNTLPRTVPGDSLAATAVGLMERSSIIALPVVDDSGTVIGVVHLHDLMRAGAA